MRGPYASVAGKDKESAPGAGSGRRADVGAISSRRRRRHDQKDDLLIRRIEETVLHSWRDMDALARAEANGLTAELQSSRA